MTIGRITPKGVNLLGTGFLLNKPGLIVTCAHVIKNDDSNLVLVLNSRRINDYQDTSDTSVQCINIKVKEINPFTDICILQIDDNVLRLPSSNIVIGGTDTIAVGENIYICGFPHCDHGRKILTRQNTSVGAKILLDSSGIKSKHIVLNIQSRPGQSGSPVFRQSDDKLIAMVIGSYAPAGSGEIIIGGIDPQTLHQTTHAISAEYIKEMI